MPTSTFFHLPEEKRGRLMEAAWREFARTEYAAASINRIIQDAGIPRGSFYQYFADKEDLFKFLLGSVYDHVVTLCLDILKGTDGDLFAASEEAFDRFAQQRDLELLPAEQMNYFLQMVRMNTGMNFPAMIHRAAAPDAQAVLARVDCRLLCMQDTETLTAAVRLVAMITGAAVTGLMNCPEHVEQHRKQLMYTLDFIKYGILAETPKPEKKQEEV